MGKFVRRTWPVFCLNLWQDLCNIIIVKYYNFFLSFLPFYCKVPIYLLFYIYKYSHVRVRYFYVCWKRDIETSHFFKITKVKAWEWLSNPSKCKDYRWSFSYNDRRWFWSVDLHLVQQGNSQKKLCHLKMGQKENFHHERHEKLHNICENSVTNIPKFESGKYFW